VSQAGSNFKNSIQDAENLLAHFESLNSLNGQSPGPELEVLKRAGLIMAMTAWETYVEDRVAEACAERLSGLTDPSIAAFVQGKLGDEISRLNNPASARTLQLFRDYAGVDLERCWHWHNVDVKTAKEQLDKYMKLRGDIVHRSRPRVPGTLATHPVNKDYLRKAIGFLKKLVQATERAFDPTM
jgi:hypothetical protein